MPRGGRSRFRRHRPLPVITLQINGKRVKLDQPTPLPAYLEMLGVDARAIAVEHNRVIIERDLYASTILRDGDTVEIVRMVGGGTTLARRF